MRHLSTVRARLAAVLVCGALLTACGSGSSGSGGDAAAASSPAPEESGPGAYTAKDEICALLDLGQLRDSMGQASGAGKNSTAALGGGPSTSCLTVLNNADNRSGGSVNVKAVWWRDVASARDLYRLSRTDTTPRDARDGKVDDLPNVGEQAHRWVGSGSADKVVYLNLVTRRSNLELVITAIADSATPVTAEQQAKVFDGMARLAEATFTRLRS
ncbi:hypothetical protein BX265_5306 [Streptomyces sp. TLI_235]|nr:hypothetical protein [Streptomyces sp. TLI_235]PBC70750.1 hypothetical protein BX265_5306 [Streptomyces sp. TLI_235]